MSNFIWILAADKNTSFGGAGVSGSYIIPKGEMKVAPKSLAGSRLWLLLRGTDDRVFLSLKIKKIEKIIEGYYEGDFLSSVGLLSSFRLVSKYSEATNYITNSVISKSLGITEISEDIAQSFLEMTLKNIEVKLAKPHEKIFSGINTKILPRSGQSLAKAAIRLVVSHFNLNGIWSEGTGNKMSAFSNFAHVMIANHMLQEGSYKFLEFFKSFDPITSLNRQSTDSEYLNDNTQSHPKIDIDFTEIEPEKIYAREFIASDFNFNDLEAALNKTEHAEKTHQEMLKDIVEFLISKGTIPYESGSIDLMYESKSNLNICEIKSSTSENLLAQASKGAFQLSCYLEELVKNYNNAAPQLILRKTGNKEMESYVTKVLSRMNIPVLFYNPNESWPNRILGLL